MLIEKLLKYINNETWKIFGKENPVYRHFPIDEFGYISCRTCNYLTKVTEVKDRVGKNKNICSNIHKEIFNDDFYCKYYSLNIGSKIILGYMVKYGINNNIFTEFFPWIIDELNTFNSIKSELGNKDFEIVETVYNLSDIKPIGTNNIMLAPELTQEVFDKYVNKLNKEEDGSDK